MSKKRFSAEQNITTLREARVLQAKGRSIVEDRQMGSTEQTEYRWHKECGGLRMDQAKRLERYKVVLLHRSVGSLITDNQQQ